MKKMLFATALLTLLILGVTYVYAQGPGFGPGAGRAAGWQGAYGWERCEPGKALSLTPEQRRKFLELRRDFEQGTAPLREAIVTKRTELRSLWGDPNAHPDAILDKERELRDLQNQTKDKALEMRLEARKILTPEQIAELGSRMGCGFARRKLGDGWAHGFGYGRGYGMGPGWGPCF